MQGVKKVELLGAMKIEKGYVVYANANVVLNDNSETRIEFEIVTDKKFKPVREETKFTVHRSSDDVYDSMVWIVRTVEKEIETAVKNKTLKRIEGN